jgi:hypothetical protein
MYVFDFHKKIPIISFNNINRLISVMQTASVLCVVGTAFLCTI